MAFTRTTTINAAPGGDSTKQAVLDLDTDLTGAFTHLNTLDTTKLASATAGTTYAPIAKGVTNGDSHDHSGGDGGTIAYSSLSGIDGDKGAITVSNSGATWALNPINSITIGATTPSTGAFTTLSATDDALLAQSSGVVIIGASSTLNNAKLEVKASATQVIALANSDFVLGTAGSSFLVDFGAATGNTHTEMQALSSGNLAYSNMVLQKSGGRLLVGTTTDNGVDKLQVNGSGSFTGQISSLKAASDSMGVGPSLIVADPNNSYQCVQQLGTSGKLNWYVYNGSWSNPMTLSSTGLTVTGTISATALPTSDPHVAGAFWRSGNTVMVSTG